MREVLVAGAEGWGFARLFWGVFYCSWERGQCFVRDFSSGVLG